MDARKYIGRIRSGAAESNPLRNSFIVDERRQWDFLTYMTDYMKLVRFYNSDNQQDGNWADLLLKDPVFYKSVIITISLDDLDEKGRLFDEERGHKLHELELAKELAQWYTTVGSWINRLAELGEMQLADKIEGIHHGIMQRYRVIINKAKKEFVEGEKDLSETFNADLNQAFLTYRKVITYIQDLTRESLIDGFFKSSGHTPDNALYLTFITLLDHLQKKVNAFPRRHLDFYYRRVLKQAEKRGVQTKAIVCFELKPGVDYANVDAHIKLSAGKQFGKNSDLFFGVDKPFSVHPVSIQQMFTIYLDKSPYLRAGTNKPIISSVLRQSIIKDGVEEANLAKIRRGVFGADTQKANITAQAEENLGEMGFVIGSPSLFLSEGIRTITVHFSMDSVSAEKSFWKLLKEIAVNNEESTRSAFNTVFSKGLIAFYTTEDEWVRVEHYRVFLDPENDVFSIQLNLDVSAPPIQKLIVSGMKWPALKFLLNPYSHIYLYSFLKELKLRKIKIDVEATELRNLSVYNDNGKVDLSAAFDVFGFVPKKGSTVRIGKSELFKKNISDLFVNIEWDNLPQDEGGFEGYYDRYPQEISNKNYKISFSVLNKGLWIPNDPEIQESETLFEVKKVITPEGYEVEILKGKSQLKFEKFRELALAKKNYTLQDPIAYNVDQLDGFIRFSLSSPEEGFGHDIYPELVTAVTLHNARKKKNVPLPNKPYVPRAKSMTLGYTSFDSLNFEESKSNMEGTTHNISEFYHISPLGWHDVVKDREVNGDQLLKNFQNEGELYLHINRAAGVNLLSIYFDLDDTISVSQLPEMPVHIDILIKSQWQRLSQKHIVKDDTLGFIKSGIIELSLQALRYTADDKSCWLRISSESEATKYPYLKGVYFNAVEAGCMEEDEHLVGLNIGAGQINKIVGAYPELQSVYQPKPSYGGVVKEGEDEFYRRVANRLRHKDRAVSAWDFEQLILDQFADVQLVKCTNLDTDFVPCPDRVKLAVIHKEWNEHDFHPFSRDMLFKMTKFLKRRGNSFLELEVINPTFEFLLVNCVIEMMDDARGGHFISEINKTINDFLSPFNQVSKGFGGLGGIVIPVALMSRLEKLPFVKAGKYLSIEHIIQQGSNQYSLGIHAGNKPLQATTPWSVMVPMVEHNISIHDAKMVEGIGHFELEKDFIIGGDLDTHKDQAVMWWKEDKEQKKKQPRETTKGLMILNLKAK